MSRSRNIKPGFYKNEDLAECSMPARLLFPGLWMLADREGRLEDRPRRIKGEIFPFDSIEVAPLLDELARWGFIKRYSVGDRAFIQVMNFTVHQNPHGTEKDSAIPDEDGFLTVHERAKSNCITGTSRRVQFDSIGINGSLTLNNVKPHEPNALIPDSPIPDSPIPETTGRAKVNALTEDATPAESLCARLKLDGVTGVNATNPTLLALLDGGMTVDEIAAIGPEAAQKGKGFAWLLAAAEGRRRDAAKVGSLPAANEKPWFLAASGIEAKGAELGITQRRDEAFPIYKQRVYAAAGVTEEALRAANIDHGARA